MRPALRTPDTAATFYFIGNYIELNAINGTDKPRVHAWFNNRSVFARGRNAAEVAREDKADIVHEMSHFIDATTTIWGLEYQYRKSLVTEALLNGEDPQQAMAVFMLNTAEIDSHHALMRRHGPGKLADCEMHNVVSQHELFGPLVTVEFHLDGKSIQDVPVSMLSVLEANAVANEVLSKIYDCRLIEEEDERIVSLVHVEQAFKDHLNNPDQTEYTIFFHLVDRVCIGRNLEDKMIFIAGLVRLVLDLGSMDMAILAPALDRTFLNVEGGGAITMDMRRGSSRPVALFKMLQWMDGWIRYHGVEEREKWLQHFQDRPEDLFFEMTKHEFDRTSAMYQIEMENFERRLAHDYGLLDHILVPMSLSRNRTLALTGNYAASFYDLAVVDPLTHSGEPLELPNRLDLHIVHLLEERLDMLIKVEALYEATKPAKFFTAY